MKLFGHDTSPYVRRVRIVFAELGIPFERDEHGWVDPVAEFLEASPIRRVPMLDRGPGRATRYVYDSRVIVALLYEQKETLAAGPPPFQPTLWRPELDLLDENVVSTADAALDSLINVFLLEKDGITPARSSYLERQVERAHSCLAWLDARFAGKTTLTPGVLAFADVAVVVAFEWIAFRSRLDLSQWANLRALALAHRERTSFATTRPTVTAPMPASAPPSKGA